MTNAHTTSERKSRKGTKHLEDGTKPRHKIARLLKDVQGEAPDT